MEEIARQMQQFFQCSPFGSEIKKYTRDRDFLINNHHTYLTETVRISQRSHAICFHNSVTPRLPTSSPVDLTLSNFISLDQLISQVDVVMKGKFMLCRTIVPPYIMTALSTVVDDPSGSTIMRFFLYNFIRQQKKGRSIEQLNDLLPVGSILVIKNPWFKTTQDGAFSLRCDNPDDIIVSPPEELLALLNPGGKWAVPISANYVKYIKKKTTNIDLVKNPTAYWKRCGNELFVKKKYREAIQAYTKALSSDKQNPDVLSNRAAAYLAMDMFSPALVDASEVLGLNDTHVKAIFRKTKALWGLRNFKEAKEFLNSLLCQSHRFEQKDVKLMHEWVATTENLITQSVEGKYPFIQDSQHDSCSVAQTNIPWAEYEGPFEVRQSFGKGRGLFATQTIMAGQLILASKAFAYVNISPTNPMRRDVFLSLNLSKNLMKDEAATEVITLIAQKLRENPDLGHELYELYAGNLGTLSAERGDNTTIVDMERIDAICTYNSFGSSRCFDFSSKSRDCGLWIKPSFINHSCLDANARTSWGTHGELLFVRAVKTIYPGDEIITPYIPLVASYAERKKWLKKFNFECSCSLCEVDKAETEDMREKRRKLLNEAENLQMVVIAGSDTLSKVFQKDSLKKLVIILKKIEGLNPHRQQKFNIFLLEILLQAAHAYVKHENYIGSLGMFEKAHELVRGSPLQTPLILTSVRIMELLLITGQMRKAQKWAENLREDTLSAFGSLETLGITYPDTVRLMKENGIPVILDREPRQ